MAETNSGATPQQAVQPRMQILAQFIRDLSFENMVMRKPISGELSPETQVQVSIDGRKRQQDDQYEVISKYIVSAKNKGGDDVLFHMELEYAGVFRITGIPEEQMLPFLLIQCPTMLFPYARRIVSDVTRDGGFPINLDMIDFLALYRQQLQRRMEAQKPTN